MEMVVLNKFSVTDFRYVYEESIHRYNLYAVVLCLCCYMVIFLPSEDRV